MKPKTLALMMVAVGCGLASMLLVQQAMVDKPGKTVKVLVAMTDIDAGVPLGETNVAFKSMPVDAVQQTAILKPEQFADRAALVPFAAGDMILTTKLGEPGERGASMLIPEGFNLTSVTVDDNDTQGGILQPKDRVKLLVSWESQTPAGRVAKTRTLMENVEVFGINGVYKPNTDVTQKTDGKTVQLLVTSQQTDDIELAKTLGEISLVLQRGGVKKSGSAGDVDQLVLEELTREKTLASKVRTPEDLVSAPVRSSESITATPAAPAVVVADRGPSALSQFLKAAEGFKMPEPPPVEAAPKPTWKMTISGSKEKKVHQLELEEPVVQSTPTRQPRPRGQLNPVEKLFQTVLPPSGDQA